MSHRSEIRKGYRRRNERKSQISKPFIAPI
jgi:hypothetical protein